MAKEEYLKPVRISELIRADLSQLPTHEVIPTERQMAEHFGVSRVTIQKALELLEREGTIYRRRGAGTFVAPRRDTLLHGLRSFSEELALRGITSETRVIDVKLISNPKSLKEKWVEFKEPAFRIERIRYQKNKPLSWEISFIGERFAPNLDKKNLTGSLYKLLADYYGQTVESADEEISSLLVVKEVSKKLQVSVGSTALEIQRHAFNKRGERIEVARAIRPSGYELLKYSVRR